MNTTLEQKFRGRSAFIALGCAAMAIGFCAPLQAQGPEAWRGFARASLTPDYSWGQAPEAGAKAPNLRTQQRAATVQRAQAVLALSSQGSATQRTLVLGLSHGAGAAATHSPIAARDLPAPDFQARWSPLRNQLADAGYWQEVGARGEFGITALVARQYFATPGFGFLPLAHEPGFASLGFSSLANRQMELGERVAGFGARLEYRMALGENTALSWSAQSKLDMDQFESVHGVYGEAGDFDSPARLGSTFEWRVNSTMSMALGAERVFYAGITPFTSQAMPVSLLSLMGDGTAPTLAWRNVTVYSAEGRWSDRWQGHWTLRYTSRQQPLPTAALYQRALSSEYANRNLQASYERRMNRFGRLGITASHAPSMAFLGPAPAFSPATFARGAATEVEAYWVVPF